MIPAVDTDTLEMLKEVIGDDLIEILQVYLNTTPGILTNIKQGIAQNKAAVVQLNTHTLKGSSANIGAILLPTLSAQLEKMAETDTLAGQADSLYIDLNQEAHKVSQFLTSYIQQF
ncbi:MAG: Hpt domain-containing protein [Gammaproteobacteria bacterium]|nr:Hpt domain-containing protein [Gammaproteobacteria bacterium]